MNVKANKHKTKRPDSKSHKKEDSPLQKNAGFANQISIKSKRKLKAQRNPTTGLWFGLGMMGVIGWSVVVPTLLGVALGVWLDKHYQDLHSWTLTFLIAGLLLGCFNAWYWVAKEQQAMRDEQDQKDD